jgi:hypothetical protein
MSTLDTGLFHRVKRLAVQTAAQHRHLAAIQHEIDVALDRGSLSEARAALERYEGALTAHFELENRVFFPALHGLVPRRAHELEVLEQEHVQLSAALGRVRSALEQAPADGSRAAMKAFLDSLRGHEQREERLVAEAREGAPSGD